MRKAKSGVERRRFLFCGWKTEGWTVGDTRPYGGVRCGTSGRFVNRPYGGCGVACHSERSEESGCGVGKD